MNPNKFRKKRTLLGFTDFFSSLMELSKHHPANKAMIKIIMNTNQIGIWDIHFSCTEIAVINAL